MKSYTIHCSKSTGLLSVERTRRRLLSFSRSESFDPKSICVHDVIGNDSDHQTNLPRRALHSTSVHNYDATFRLINKILKCATESTYQCEDAIENTTGDHHQLHLIKTRSKRPRFFQFRYGFRIRNLNGPNVGARILYHKNQRNRTGLSVVIRLLNEHMETFVYSSSKDRR